MSAPVSGVTSSMPVLHVGTEDGVWYATSDLPDGYKYLAVADTYKQLLAQIHESATLEGWPGWVAVG